MPAYTKFRGAHGAIFALGMAAAAMSCDSRATLILAESLPETAFSALPATQPPVDDPMAAPTKLPEILPVLPAPNVVHPMLEFGEFRDGDFAHPRQPGAYPYPGNRQSKPVRVPADDSDSTLNPVFRRLVNVNTGQAAAVGLDQERPRRDRARDSTPAEMDFIWSAENQIKDAVVNTVSEGVVALSLEGIRELSVTLSGDRRTVNYNGIELFSLLRYDADNDKDPPAVQVVHSAGAASAKAQPRQEVPRDHDPAAVSKLTLTSLTRELLTDPVTILVALGLLVIWKLSESIADRKRR